MGHLHDEEGQCGHLQNKDCWNVTPMTREGGHWVAVGMRVDSNKGQPQDDDKWFGSTLGREQMAGHPHDERGWQDHPQKKR